MSNIWASIYRTAVRLAQWLGAGWVLAGVGCWSGRWKWLNPVVCTCKGRGPRFACQTLGSVVGSKQSGIFVHTRGVLTCENDNIFQNAKAGVQVKNRGGPGARGPHFDPARGASVLGKWVRV